MKKKTSKNKKFNLEKFQVSKLYSMSKIRGGSDGTIITTTGTDSNNNSSKACKVSILCN
jgi:hypothetical protein